MNTQNNPEQEAAIQQLKSYIQQQLRTGLHPNEIHAQLQQAGWQAPMIDHAFQLVQAEVMPQLTQPELPSTVAGEQSANSPQPATQQQAQAANNAPASPVPQLQQPAAVQPQATTVTRGRFQTGWLLFKQSIRVLRNNKNLMRYVVTSFAASLVLTLIFVLIFVLGRHTLFLQNVSDTSGGNNAPFSPAGYGVLLAYYVLAFFIVNLFSAGMTANVIELFQGKSQTYAQYMKIARSKGWTLFVFSVIEATVGMLLRAIAERSRLLGRIAVWIVGAAWSLARLFAVPIIVTSDDKAFTSIKHSTKLLIATWGENVVGRVTFGGVALIGFLIIVVPISFVLFVLGALIGHAAGTVVAFLLVVLLYLAFCIVITTASSVLNTALFYYAQYRQIPAAFDPQLINSVFIRKKRKGVLGLGGKTS